MLTAKRFPNPERGKRSQKIAEISANFGISKGHAKDLLSEARKVVEFLPARADEVILKPLPTDAKVILNLG